MSAARLAGSVVALGLALGALTACSGSVEPGEETSSEAPVESSSPTPTETATSEPVEPYLPVPDGVELTEPGTALDLADPAVVAWEPAKGGGVSVARIKILAFEQAEIGVLRDWKLDKETRRATPYFVRARVTNRGTGGLGGQEVPLYAQAPDNVLVAASSFKGQFGPCSPAKVPTPLRPGDKAVVCLVYLLPEGESAAGVSFYPEPSFVPIRWDGEPTRFRVGG